MLVKQAFTTYWLERLTGGLYEDLETLFAGVGDSDNRWYRRSNFVALHGFLLLSLRKTVTKKKQSTPHSPLLLIDAMNLVFRSHFTHQLTYEGKFTGATYGFIKKLHSLRIRFKTNRVVVCWDYGHPGTAAVRKSWRARAYEEYKANRVHSDDSAAALSQIADIHQAVSLLGFWNFAVPGLEADDLMGIGSGFEKETGGGECCLFSGDRDLYQLLDDNTTLLQPRAGGAERTVTAEIVLEETGIPVAHWARYLALGGDSSDNIRPIPGFGAARAKKAVMLGAAPEKSWKEQSAATTKGLSKMCPLASELWPRVRDAYKIVVLPRYLAPNSIESQTHLVYRYLQEEDLEYALHVYLEPAKAGWGRAWKGAPSSTSVEQFVAFCADHGFEEFISKRHVMMG